VVALLRAEGGEEGPGGGPYMGVGEEEAFQI